MKKAVFLLSVCFAANTMAATVSQQNELNNVQMQYQSLLKAKSADFYEVQSLQKKLKHAEQRLEEAQLEVNRLRAQLIMREGSQQEYDKQIKEMGERLDKAWHAVRGR